MVCLLKAGFLNQGARSRRPAVRDESRAAMPTVRALFHPDFRKLPCHRSHPRLAELGRIAALPAACVAVPHGAPGALRFIPTSAAACTTGDKAVPNRRLRDRTESADPAMLDAPQALAGLCERVAITAGGELHPALRTLCAPDGPAHRENSRQRDGGVPPRVRKNPSPRFRSGSSRSTSPCGAGRRSSRRAPGRWSVAPCRSGWRR